MTILIISKNAAEMKRARSSLSIVLGITFLATGWMKGVDPYGTSLKIGEYVHWMAGVDFSGTVGYHILMFCSVFLCSLELFLGFCLFWRIYVRNVSILSAVLIFLFTALTTLLLLLPDAPILECGCFGDVLHLSPLFSFVKNVVLLAFCLILVFLDRHTSNDCIYDWKKALGILLFSVAIPIYSAVYLPPFDFLGYNRGVSLLKDENFHVYNNQIVDIKEPVLAQRECLFFVVHNKETDLQQIDAVSKLMAKQDIQSYLLCSSQDSKTINDYLYADELTLKMLVRKNAGVVYVSDGIIKGRWPLHLFPSDRSKIKQLVVRQERIPCLYILGVGFLFFSIGLWLRIT